MFADQYTIVVGKKSDGVTDDAVIIRRVNQDNYSSEYRYRDATRSLTVSIRHSEEKAPKPKSGSVVVAQKMLRHNVYMEYTLFPTPTTLEQKHTVSSTLRLGEYADPVITDTLAKAFNAFVGYTLLPTLLDDVS